MVRSACGLAPSVTCNYDSGCISRLQSTFPQSFTTQRFQLNVMTTDDERKYSGDFTDLLTNKKELADECMVILYLSYIMIVTSVIMLVTGKQSK